MVNVEEICMDEDEYEKNLTEVHGTIKVGSLEFDAGKIIRELDETAFRCGLADEESSQWMCGECGMVYAEEDKAIECCEEDLIDYYMSIISEIIKGGASGAEK